MTYRFEHVDGPPVAAVDYEWRFQHDFADQHDAFRAVLEVARRAFRGELPALPLALPMAAAER